MTRPRWVVWPFGPFARLWHAVWGADPDDPRVWWTRCRRRFVWGEWADPERPAPPIVGNRCATCSLGYTSAPGGGTVAGPQ